RSQSGRPHCRCPPAVVADRHVPGVPLFAKAVLNQLSTSGRVPDVTSALVANRGQETPVGGKSRAQKHGRVRRPESGHFLARRRVPYPNRRAPFTEAPHL